jgi:carbon-monoxide dehydrogenase medium subunit
MYNFDYQKPSDQGAAVAAMKAEGAMALSGGQTLIPTLKQRLNQPDTLVDLTGVAGMSGISSDGSTITIGAATVHREVAESADVQSAIPGLAHLAGRIGDPQVRNKGTIGGSLANNDPAACYPAAVLALGATVVTNAREIAADDFFAGIYTTVLAEDEIITAVKFPIPSGSSYQKFEQPASRFALTGVFVAKTSGGVRVAVTGAAQDGVFRHAGLEAALNGSFTADAANGVAVSAEGMSSDLHGTPEYRANLVKVLTKRAVAEIG